MGYVYLFMAVDVYGGETYKIGITKNNPEKRVKQLSTGNSNKISTLKYYESANYKKIERMLHKQFQHKKTETKNEWFKLSDEDINTFISLCEKYDGIAQYMIENNHFYN